MTGETTLLLVDDDDAFRGVMSEELKRLGYQVRTASTGKEALEVLKEQAPQVVLLDLRLPDLSGLEVLPLIKEEQEPCEVIMLTGHGSIDSAREPSTIWPSPALWTSFRSGSSGPWSTGPFTTGPASWSAD